MSEPGCVLNVNGPRWSGDASAQFHMERMDGRVVRAAESTVDTVIGLRTFILHTFSLLSSLNQCRNIRNGLVLHY